MKGIIKKSYGQISRPAVLKFTSSRIPEKGHCTCPIGLSGICCHILCLLHFLTHLTKTGEKFVALTATQQLQKWHKKGQGKGSIPMLPVHKLVKVPSARLKKVKKGMKPSDGLKTGTDIEKPTLKRDSETQMQKYDKKFKEIGYKNIEKHFQDDVLQMSDLGRKTSLGIHLNYKYTDISRQALALDHDYCHPGTSENSLLTGNRNNTAPSKESVDNCASSVSIDVQNNSTAQSKILINYVCPSDSRDIENQIKVQWKESSDLNCPREVLLNLREKSAIKPQGCNYHEVKQNTDLWQELRRGIITASKLPYFLGLYGEDKFNKYWFCIRNKVSEKTMFPTQFHNFEWGHRFEETAIKYFESITGSTTSKCVFFVHPSDENYGASSDAICPGPVLLEIKTRAENSTSPMDNLKGEHLIQTQLQMACTGFDYVIVESFRPESNSANFFLVRKDELLFSVLKDITDSILKLNVVPFSYWVKS